MNKTIIQIILYLCIGPRVLYVGVLNYFGSRAIRSMQPLDRQMAQGPNTSFSLFVFLCDVRLSRASFLGYARKTGFGPTLITPLLINAHRHQMVTLDDNNIFSIYFSIL